MMQFKPYLIIKRLIVLCKAKIVYDEKFHTGVNIICGDNSTGKSTIADFIFYSLGGELSKWKKEAKECDLTLVEVELNGKPFSLKREVSIHGKRGMDIFPGNIGQSNKADITDWLRYPYSATVNKESFYQTIFKELEIPYSKSDDKNSITLHQLLRLMYVDQMTSIDRLFKFDRFDSPNRRKAIGELLLGISDFDLYHYRVKKQKLESKLDNMIKEIKTIHRFFGEEVKTIDQIEGEINHILNTIKKLENKLSYNDPLDDKHNNELNKLRNKHEYLRKIKDELTEDRISTSFELEDSRRFVDSLNIRIDSLSESTRMMGALSNIGFHYCPSCFEVLDQKLSSKCNLCGSQKKHNVEEYDPTFKIRKEIEFQISESLFLIQSRQDKLINIETELTKIDIDIKNLESKISVLEKPLNEQNSNTRNIYLKIGSLSQQIDILNLSQKRFSKLYGLYSERDALQTELNTTLDEIEKRESKIEKELKSKRKILSSYTKEIILADSAHEEAFKEAKNIQFDFGEDRVTVDDRALFSASSMVYLKNAFRLALLKASCLDRTYLYPRFLLMDNVEDKGMQPSRSHLFQSEIVTVSSKIKVPHQIIFSTSMITDELKKSNLCVGRYYTKDKKSLDI